MVHAQGAPGEQAADDLESFVAPPPRRAHDERMLATQHLDCSGCEHEHIIDRSRVQLLERVRQRSMHSADVS